MYTSFENVLVIDWLQLGLIELMKHSSKLTRIMWLNVIMIYLLRSFRPLAVTFQFTAPFPWPTFHCTLMQLDCEVTTVFERINRAAAVSFRPGCIISLGPFPFWLQLHRNSTAKPAPFSPHPIGSAKTLHFPQLRFRHMAADLILSTTLHSFILPEHQENQSMLRAWKGR